MKEKLQILLLLMESELQNSKDMASKLIAKSAINMFKKWIEVTNEDNLFKVINTMNQILLQLISEDCSSEVFLMIMKDYSEEWKKRKVVKV